MITYPKLGSWPGVPGIGVGGRTPALIRISIVEKLTTTSDAIATVIVRLASSDSTVTTIT